LARETGEAETTLLALADEAKLRAKASGQVGCETITNQLMELRDQALLMR